MVTTKVRWLAGATGFVTLLAGWLVFSSFASVASGFSLDWQSGAWWGAIFAGPIFLSAGAVLVGSWQRTGIWLMWIGALFLTPSALFYNLAALIKPMESPNPMIVSLSAAVVLLVVLCDVALGIEAAKSVRWHFTR